MIPSPSVLACLLVGHGVAASIITTAAPRPRYGIIQERQDHPIGVDPWDTKFPVPTKIATIAVHDQGYLTEDTPGKTKWIGVDNVFTPKPDADGVGLAISAGFIVAKVAEGLEITVSESVHADVEAMLAGIEACPLPAKLKRQPPVIATGCQTRQFGEAINRFKKNPQLAEKLKPLRGQIVKAEGGAALEAELAAAGEELTTVDRDLVDFAVRMMGSEFATSTTVQTTGVGTIALFLAHVLSEKNKWQKLDHAWKWFTSRPFKIKKPNPNQETDPNKGCPTDKTRWPECKPDYCKGMDQGKCTTEGQFLGCNCLRPSNDLVVEYLPDNWSDMWKKIGAAPAAPEPLPQLDPVCAPDRKQVTINKKDYQILGFEFCKQAGSFKESKNIKVPGELIKFNPAWTFTFDFTKDGDKNYGTDACPKAIEALWSSCGHTSHSMERSAHVVLPGLGKLSISFTEAAPERKSLTCNHQAHLFADVGFERDAMLKFTDLNCYHQNFPWSDTSRLSSKPAGDPERVPAMNPQGVVFDKQIKVEISVGHQHCPDNMDAGFVPSTAALMTPEFCKEYFRQIMDDCEPFKNVHPKFVKFPGVIEAGCFKFEIKMG